MSDSSLKQRLDRIYQQYNRKEFLNPDPLEFLHADLLPADREIVGLIAASLAYGRVAQIIKSVSHILRIMGPSPLQYVLNATPDAMAKDFSGFVHRFATGSHLSALLLGIKQCLKSYGDLNRCFLKGFSEQDDTILTGLTQFVEALTAHGEHKTGHLIPNPQKGSACKRLNLYLRWMVRKDRVDPGCWQGIPASKLIIPLDTHMHRIGSFLSFTKRKQAHLITALEITEGFRSVRPEDPVRYDFALTRLGIRGDLNFGKTLEESFGPDPNEIPNFPIQ